MHRGRALGLALTLLVACSSSGSESPLASDSCQSVCGKLAKCGGADFCANCANTFDRWRPEVRSEFAKCLNDGRTPCNGTTAQSCTSIALAAVPTRDTDKSYQTACTDKRTACSNPYPDDYCSSFLFADEWVKKLQDCVAKACADVGPCIKAIVKP